MFLRKGKQQQQQHPSDTMTTLMELRQRTSHTAPLLTDRHTGSNIININNTINPLRKLSIGQRQQQQYRNSSIPRLLWLISTIAFTVVIIYMRQQYFEYDNTNTIQSDSSDIQNFLYNDTMTSTISHCSFNDLLYTFGSVQKFQDQIDQCNKLNNNNNQKTTIKYKDFSLRREKTQQQNCCWLLKDIIVRIPVSAIVNRNTLIKLGGGRKGGVYKAIIKLQLSSSNERTILKNSTINQKTYCTIAVKTDYCTTQSTLTVILNDIQNLLFKIINKILTKNNNFINPTMRTESNIGSCIQQSSKLSGSTTYIGNEYIGSIVYYSQLIQLYSKLSIKEQQYALQNNILPFLLEEEQDTGTTSTTTGRDIHNSNNNIKQSSSSLLVPGLLPTYGVVVNDDNLPIRSVYNIPRYLWSGSVLHSTMNSNIIGVIIPIQTNFESLVYYNHKPWNSTRSKQFNHSIYEITSNISMLLHNIILPSAIGLQYVNTHMRLAYQDVKEKNIGLIYSTNNINNNNNENSNTSTTTTTIQTSFVYDHSYIAVAPQSTSSVSSSSVSNKQCNNITCQYCYENNDFPITNRKIDLYSSQYDNIQSDYYNYRRIILSLLNGCPQDQQNNECQILHTIISNISSIDEFVTTIQYYIHNNNMSNNNT